MALAANGMPARVVLAVLESAGILYANLSPVIVSALARSVGFDAESAGLVFALNMYGTALGGFLVVFLLRWLDWRRTAAGLLVFLIALDLLSALAGATEMLYGLRFLHGLAGGSLIGISLAVIARTTSPERTIALFIAIQLVLGGVITVVLSPWLATAGPGIVWLSLVGFSVLALVLLPLLGPYPVEQAPQVPGEPGARAGGAFLVAALVGLFLFQSGEMAAFAYVIELGLSHRFDMGFTSTAVAMSLWIGGPAALLVTWWSTRSGRLVPAGLATVAMIASVALLLVPEEAAFIAANVGFGVFFSIAFPYLMGIASELDNTGQMAALAGFAGNLGLASGPAVAALLVGEGDYSQIVRFAVPMLLASLGLMAAPARMLDGLNLTGRVRW